MNHMPTEISPRQKRPSPIVFPDAPKLDVSDEQLEKSRIVGFVSHDERTRPINLLRTELLRLLDADGLRLFGVTSPTPASGKTFLTLNLSAALARFGGRAVLVCDFDLRRGSVGKALGFKEEIDLSGYLRGEVDHWSQAVYRVGDTDMYILPCTSHLRGSSEMIDSERFATMMRELRDLPPDVLVVCDLPPVFASDDAINVSQHLDAYLMVVEYGKNTAKQVREAMRVFNRAPCLGTILNRYRGGLFDAYGYGYGDPYGLKHYGRDS